MYDLSSLPVLTSLDLTLPWPNAREIGITPAHKALFIAFIQRYGGALTSLRLHWRVYRLPGELKLLDRCPLLENLTLMMNP